MRKSERLEIVVCYKWRGKFFLKIRLLSKLTASGAEEGASAHRKDDFQRNLLLIRHESRHQWIRYSSRVSSCWRRRSKGERQRNLWGIFECHGEDSSCLK